MDLQSILQGIFSGASIETAIALATIILIAAGTLLKNTKQTLYRLYIVIIAAAALLVIASWYLQAEPLLIAGIVLLPISLLAPIITWAYYDQQLEKIAQKNNLTTTDHNPIEAYSMLKALNEKHLAGKQLERYERYMVYTYIALGNGAVAKKLLEDKERKTLIDEAFRHFFLHIIAENAGDFAQSYEHLQQAKKHKDDKGVDSLTTLQLEHNQAVLHTNSGQYATADAEFEKALAHARDLGVKNKDFLNVLFTNYALNKTRLDLPSGGTLEGWQAIQDYADTLNLTLASDQIALFNLKLLFSRQIGASQLEKDTLYIDHISNMITSKQLDNSEKTIGMGSMARICWADALSPTPGIL